MTPEKLPTEFCAAVNAAWERQLTPAARQRVAAALDTWLSFTARTQPSDELPARLAEMRKRFGAFADRFTVEYTGSSVVVKVSGDAQETWVMLTRGTNWFDPLAPEQATSLVVKAVLD